MEVRPEKIIEALACLNVTADHLLNLSQEDAVAAMLAARCIECAAALRTSLHMDGLVTIQTVGVH
ncbi:hypothetical protein PQR01_00255 [Paraburkholderia rhynchosiae]|uniref:Uncharacterized protein n=1 Tax=Paraburkholderia rhynchosiae TaxID=487049 RepID=A0ACC7N4J2_9BURK